MKISIGDKIKFQRHGINIVGTVTQTRLESVIVKITEEDAEYLKIETPFTVVSLKNCQRLEK